MPYVDTQTIDNPTAGQPIPAAWADQVRNNLEFLIDPPAASVYNSADQTVADNTPTDLTADSEFFDNDSIHSTSTNTARLTIVTAGRYLFFSTVRFTADVDGIRNVKFRHVTPAAVTTDYECQQIPSGSAVSNTIITATRTIVCAAGDYVMTRVNHTAGANNDVRLFEFGCTFLTR